MSTSSAEGNRNKENYSRGNGKWEYRNTDDRSRERGNGENRNRQNRSSGSSNGSVQSSGSRQSRPYNNVGGEARQGHSYGNYKPRNHYMVDKDKDEEQPRRRSEPRRTTDKETRYKEQQPDKIDIINRLEKEKKAMQKKEEEKKKNSRHAKTVAKPKRINNIDWTREYENGSYDDDDMDMYLSQ